jgi:DNA-binding NtrC family response regulator
MSRVLVLDDEPLIAMMVEDWLAELGHETVGPARTVAAAIALIEQGGLDAAILDLSVDGEPSYAVAAILAARSVPFAFATGHGTGRLAAPYDSVPMLGKPFDLDGVRAIVARLVGES